MTKWELRKLKAEDKALRYLREEEGKFLIFWATENRDRACALERLEKKGYIGEYTTELDFPFGWYKFVSDKNISLDNNGWLEIWECKIIDCEDKDYIIMDAKDILNPHKKIINGFIKSRNQMIPNGIDKNLKEGYILYWYLDNDGDSFFSFKNDVEKKYVK